jgi:hypothetical protein
LTNAFPWVSLNNAGTESQVESHGKTQVVTDLNINVHFELAFLCKY